MGICTKKYAFAALFAALFAVLLIGCEPDSTTTVITLRTGVSSDINPLSVTGFTPTTTSNPNGEYSLITDLSSIKFSQDYAETGDVSIDLTKPVYKKENTDGTIWYLWASLDPSRYVLSRSGIEDGWFFEDATAASATPKDVQQWKRSTASAADIATDDTKASDEPTATARVIVTSLSIALKSGSSDSIFIGDRIELEPTIMPSNATDKSLEWNSSDTAVATVDANGAVTAVAAGSSTITAASKDGSAITSNAILITVAAPVTISGQPTTAYDSTTKKLSFSVTFSETVTVDTSGGTPTYTFAATKSANIAAVTKTADYASGSGTATLVFEYTKEDGVFGTISYEADPIDFNGGSLTGTSVTRVSPAGITAKASAATIAADVSAVGIASATTIPNTSLSASSQWSADTPATRGRLNGTGGWSPSTTATTEWWQVDLGKELDIVRVATQGRGDNSSSQQWIRTYKLQYSLDNNTWFSYSNGQVLTGNTNKTSIVTVNLTPFKARYVRILPQTYSDHPVGRFELYEGK